MAKGFKGFDDKWLERHGKVVTVFDKRSPKAVPLDQCVWNGDRGTSLQEIMKNNASQKTVGKARGTRGRKKGPNATERKYNDLLMNRLLAKEILWYKFECIRLRLADNTWFEIDFMVMTADREIEMHEVKFARERGKPHFEDDAKVKLKVAAEMYPFRFVVAFLDKDQFKSYSI